jgi:pimeloyl-ACP methyl ester carboxylesterase
MTSALLHKIDLLMEGRISVWIIGLAVLLCPIAACSRESVPQETGVSDVSNVPDAFVQLGDARLRYKDIGRGEPVVLLHGYSGRLDDWITPNGTDFLIGDSLSKDYRVIVFDMRGSGQSSKFADFNQYGAEMADDVIRLMDKLKIGRAHVVGASMGALVGANTAARFPDRVASLSLIAGPFYRDAATLAHETTRWLAELEAGRGMTAFYQWLFPGMDAATAGDLSMQSMAGNDLASLIAVMRSLPELVMPLDRQPAVPVLIAIGGDDPLAPLSRDLAARWPGARLLEVAGANHGTIAGRTQLLDAVRALIANR